MTLQGNSPEAARAPFNAIISNVPTQQPITHYENFPVASWLCPAHLRAPIAAIYHFARTADDIADEGDDTAAQRLEKLSQYRQALGAALEGADPRGGPWPAVYGALQQAITAHKLPARELHALLDAFTQDTQKSRDAQGYASEAELLDYCSKSANPVGRLLLHLYGVTDEDALRQSDAICTALQLINFWQDLSVDIPRGRYYLSDEALQKYGATRSDVMAQKINESTTRLVKMQVGRAREIMLSGAALVHRIPGRAGWELRLVVQGGLRILDKIVALDYATLQKRPTLRPWDVAVMLWRSFWMRPRNGTMAR